MSYVHEGATDKALAELEKMVAIDKAARDLAALSGDVNQMGDILLEAGPAPTRRRPGTRSRWRPWTKADVPGRGEGGDAPAAPLRRGARRPRQEGPGRGQGASAGAYATAVDAKKIPFEVRQSHELAGRIALAGEELRGGGRRSCAQANQQDPRVLYPPGRGPARARATPRPRSRRRGGRGLQRAVEHVRLRARQGAGDGDGSEEELEAVRCHRPGARIIPGDVTLRRECTAGPRLPAAMPRLRAASSKRPPSPAGARPSAPGAPPRQAG